MTVAARAAREEALRRLLSGAARRYRELGGLRGSVRVPDLSEAEARAIAGLGVTGRSLPRAGDVAVIELVRLDDALGGANGEGGLLEALELAGENTTTDGERATVEETRERRFWESFREHAACADNRVVAWLEQLPGHPSLASLARAQEGAALGTCLSALASIDGCERIDRALLARDAAGDPHALDEGRPATTLLLAALADRDGLTRVPGAAGERRALLARHGVLSDPLASTVLVLGLRVTGTGPAARILMAADGGHVVLTLSQLTRSQLSGKIPHLFSSEGPIVIRGAEQALGNAAAPLVCTDGQPSAACDELLRQLKPAGATIRHSGDFDWGGLRIGGLLGRRHGARPWRHSVNDYARHVARLADRQRLNPPRGSAPDGYRELWEALIRRRIPIWQEDLLDELVDDLTA
jgi:uncharacterized protein (TIGR02679 family)